MHILRICLISLALLTFPLSALASQSIGSVIQSSGGVHIFHHGKKRPLLKGAALSPSDKIETSKHGRVELGLMDGSKVYIGYKSRLKIKEFDVQKGKLKTASFFMHSGKVRFLLSRESSAKAKFKVKTTTARVNVKHADFLMDVPQTNFALQKKRATSAPTRIFLFKGGLNVRSVSGKRLYVKAGEQLTVDYRGKTKLAMIKKEVVGKISVAGINLMDVIKAYRKKHPMKHGRSKGNYPYEGGHSEAGDSAETNLIGDTGASHSGGSGSGGSSNHGGSGSGGSSNHGGSGSGSSSNPGGSVSGSSSNSRGSGGEINLDLVDINVDEGLGIIAGDPIFMEVSDGSGMFSDILPSTDNGGKLNHVNLDAMSSKAGALLEGATLKGNNSLKLIEAHSNSNGGPKHAGFSGKPGIHAGSGEGHKPSVSSGAVGSGTPFSGKLFEAHFTGKSDHNLVGNTKNLNFSGGGNRGVKGSVPNQKFDANILNAGGVRLTDVKTKMGSAGKLTMYPHGTGKIKVDGKPGGGFNPGLKTGGLKVGGFNPGIKTGGLKVGGFNPGIKTGGLKVKGFNPGLKTGGLKLSGLKPGGGGFKPPLHVSSLKPKMNTSVIKPKLTKPVVRAPVLRQFSISKPVVRKPVVAKPVLRQFSISKPLVRVPVVRKPIITKPLVRKPTIARPVIRKPVVRKPIIARPVIRKPVVRKPVIARPVIRKPVVRKPIIARPVIRKPVVRRPIIAKPVIRKPVVRRPVIARPVIRKPVVRKPIIVKPVIRKPLVYHPVFRKPVFP